MARKPVLEFWFDFASAYSYVSAMRIDELAGKADIDVRWMPFLLGPIFKAQGWDTSPFMIYPAKGRYMWRDVERLCARYGLAFKRPHPFPQNSLLPARCAVAAADEVWLGQYCRKMFELEFGEGADISVPETNERAISSCGGDPAIWIARADERAVKDLLRQRVDTAAARGIFGAPSFVCEDGELFWGDDRIEQAMAWAARAG